MARQQEELAANIQVNLDGSFKLEVLNGDGQNCLAFTEKLEQALGTVTERQMKPEAENRSRTATVTETEQRRLRQ